MNENIDKLIEDYEKENEELILEFKQNKLHKEQPYINIDGIVNSKEWFKQEKKILFILKEAYHSDKTLTEYNLIQELSEYNPWGKIWQNVGKWSYGIRNTNEESIPDFAPFEDMAKDEVMKMLNDEINKIAVINIKKSNGKSKSDYDDLWKYAKDDKELLKKQIKLIKPNTIVCCSTFEYFNYIIDNEIDKKDNHCANWFYYTNDGTLVLDFYHPSNQWPILMNYYSLCAIYQKALQSKEGV